jgi:NTE family protein
VRAEHVLASCAIPLGFPPQWVEQPAGSRGWYVDGGVRLNTPLRPAVALGADRIIVVSAMSTEFGGPLPPSKPGEPVPDMAATGAQVMHAVLADRMTEDIRTLRSRNSAAAQAQAAGTQLQRSSGDPVRSIPLLVVSPAPGQLGVLAADILDEKVRGSLLGRVRSSDHYALDRALRGIGDGAGRRELLSYLFFDADYFSAQIDLGRRAASAALDVGWSLT